MNIKKALAQSVILYAIVFLAASALLSFKDQPLFTIAVFIVSAATNYFLSKEYYFKGTKLKKPLKEGLMLGVTMEVVMILIDIPVMVYGFAASIGWNYFMDWTMVFGYVVNVAIPVVVAYRMK